MSVVHCEKQLEEAKTNLLYAKLQEIYNTGIVTIPIKLKCVDIGDTDCAYNYLLFTADGKSFYTCKFIEDDEDSQDESSHFTTRVYEDKRFVGMFGYKAENRVYAFSRTTTKLFQLPKDI